MAVPLVLAASIALFNNILRLFDKVETAYLKAKEDLSKPVDETAWSRALDQTQHLNVALVGNAYYAICIGLAHLLVAGLRDIPFTAFPYPRIMLLLRPDWVALSFQVGLASLIVAIVVNQFRAVPELIGLYRYLSVDRHRQS